MDVRLSKEAKEELDSLSIVFHEYRRRLLSKPSPTTDQVDALEDLLNEMIKIDPRKEQLRYKLLAFKKLPEGVSGLI